jgi:O-antigen/teichoic acid export membrane protein
MALSKILQQLRPDPNNQGRQRIVRSTLTGATALIVRGMGFAVSLFMIPLVAQSLGIERYGMWLTLSSLLGWAGLVDLGLANSLTNALATADGQEDRQTAQEAVSSAFWIILMLTITVGLGLCAAFPWVPWGSVLNIKSQTALAEVNSAVLVTFLLILGRLLFAIPGQVYGAYQEGYLYQLWSILGSTASLVGLVIAINFKGGTTVLLAAFFGSAFLTDIGAALHLFGKRRRWLRPKFSYFRWASSKFLLKSGIQIWIAQVAAIAIFQTDLIIVAQIYGAKTVASYGTAVKLFSLILLIQSVFVLPLWPAYSEALARGDFSWIKKTFRRSMILSCGWSLSVGLLITFCSPFIIKSWVNPESVPSTLTLLALMLRTVTLAADQCLSVLGNGLALFRIQAIIAPAFAVSNLALALFLTRTIGVSGVAWATVACVCVFSLLIFGIRCRVTLQQLSSPSLD